MNTSIQDQITKAYQQTPAWRLQIPADAALGVASAAWAPVATELARHTGASASAESKQAAYHQVVHMLQRTAAEGAQTTSFGPAERREFGGFVQVLLQHYQRLLA